MSLGWRQPLPGLLRADGDQGCAHVALWKVGSARPQVVPGTGTGSVRSIALVTDPRGPLTVAWYDASRSLISAAGTNTTATCVGVVRTLRPPGRAAVVESLHVQGSSGRLDDVVNILASSGVSAFWHTRTLPGLTLRISPARISHTAARRVVFSVTDAGQGVNRATVT